MSKELYYTEPLQAAYMAKEFGVKYQCGNNTNCTVLDFQSYNFPIYPTNGHIYNVLPDSYRIFEPQIGDLVELQTDGFITIMNNHNLLFVKTAWYIKNLRPSLNLMKSLAIRKIIQRDDKPFFWPESEEK